MDVTILEGRETAVKERMIERLTQVVVDELQAAPCQVRVILREVPRGSYAVAGKPVQSGPSG